MRVLLVCDGGGALGVGHLMRSLALAEAAAAAGHDVVVAGHFEGSFLQGQLAAAPVRVVALPVRMADRDLGPLLDVVARLRPDVVHLDSYEADRQLAEILSSRRTQAAGGDQESGGFVVSNMEDGTFGRRPADVVIDPTLGAELTARPQDATTWLLRGSRYTPVRARVLDAAGRRSPPETGASGADLQAVEVGRVERSVLVVMGGTDPVGLVPVAVSLLAHTGLALEVTAIAVGENAVRARAAAAGSRLSLTVLAPVDDLAVRMAAQDLVVSAAGTSVWELCCIGVPAAVIWAVDNQREGFRRILAAGAAIGLGGPELGGAELSAIERGGIEGGRIEGGGIEDSAIERAVDQLTRVLTDPGVRAGLVRAGRRVVDGLGAWRVVQTWEQALAIRAMAGQPQPSTETTGLLTRRATLADSRLLWVWRNDPATRAGSRSSAKVTWEDHVAWLSASLARDDRVLLVAQDREGLVGTVRWDLVPEPDRPAGAGDEWEVSITVAPKRRGQSLSRPLLRAGEVALSNVRSADSRLGGTGVGAYLAVVQVDNQPSIRLFETSAYVPDLPPDRQGFMRFRKDARLT